MTGKNKIKCWVEAARPRTLPVSLAGVAAGVGLTLADGAQLKAAPALLCALFALLAQVASNFANEYFDFKAGIDRPGRVGPRRGVTEGDITPAAMRCALFATLAAAAVAGCSLIYWGGWWLLAAGVVIMLGALAYSAGPYPLSRHGLGEIAVEVFFGLVPVGLTYYIQTGGYSLGVFVMSIAVGLLAANILAVNNYRDIDDDRAVGKHTLANTLPRRSMPTLYIINAVSAVLLMLPVWLELPSASLAVPALYIIAAAAIAVRMAKSTGRKLNPLLGMTAVLMSVYALLFLLINIAVHAH